MSLTRKLVAVASSALLAVLPLATHAAESVRLESEVTVANVTGGVTPKYNTQTIAKVDDIVRVQVWYHNREEADSGLIANNLRVKINVPQTPGVKQPVTSTVSADGANTITDTATVGLSMDRAYLEFIPGTVMWRHNAGTNENVNYVTQKIGDEVVTGQNGLVIENAKPCFNFEATVTAEFRVKASVVTITKQVRKVGEKDWKLVNTANPGDTLEYLITFKNEGNTTLNKVVVGDNMPAFVTYVPGSTQLRNSTFPNGTKITSNNVTTGGIEVGNYGPGGGGYVWFQAKIDSNLKPGNYQMKNVGLVRPEGMSTFFNVATTNVTVPVGGSAPTPVTPAPEAPQPLPETGMGAAAGLAGVTGLGYATRGYIRSKRSLVDALVKHDR